MDSAPVGDVMCSKVMLHCKLVMQRITGHHIAFTKQTIMSLISLYCSLICCIVSREGKEEEMVVQSTTSKELSCSPDKSLTVKCPQQNSQLQNTTQSQAFTTVDSISTHSCGHKIFM